MNEESVDLSWAQGQLAKAQVPVPVGKAVIALLTTWAELNFPNEVQQKQAVELFSALSLNKALSEESEAVWKPVQVGFQVNVGDTVRIRNDAFAGDAGRVHNGRVGRVLAKRSGDIIVKTTDDGPLLDGAHYPPSVLEKRVS